MSSGKWGPFCLHLNVSIHSQQWLPRWYITHKTIAETVICLRPNSRSALRIRLNAAAAMDSIWFSSILLVTADNLNILIPFLVDAGIWNYRIQWELVHENKEKKILQLYIN